MDYKQKVSIIRKKMQDAGISAYIIQACDPHKSIAITDHWKTVQWLTGFTGWICTLVLTGKTAGFWTDGRYVAQAQRELPKGEIQQYCSSNPEDESYINWLIKQLSEGDRVGLNGGVVTKSDFDVLTERFAEKKIYLVPQFDFIGEIWEDRPDIPNNAIFELELKYCGKTRETKLAEVREVMKHEGAYYYLLSALDNIAWLTNLRGSDSPLYPIFHAYMLISVSTAVLFTKIQKIPAALISVLDKAGIVVRGLNEIIPYLSRMPNYGAIFYDPSNTAYSLVDAIPSSVFKIESLDIVTKLKALKNSVELKNIRQANIQEAVCVTRLIKFVKDNIGKKQIDEYQVGQWINTERNKFAEFLEPANVPIVGCYDHAVELHYRPTQRRSTVLPQEGFLLFDLCAHYLNGSTDITRTVALGNVTEQMRHDYTLVLKSQIKLATQKFIYGTTGPELDAIGKSLIWNEEINNPAGTGHGIGYCLYIQEGPCKIAIDSSPYFAAMMTTPIEPGMIFSDEPGVYKKGLYAIRLENTILAKQHIVNSQGRFLSFDTLTFVPYEPECIDCSMLSMAEKEWLDSYNATVFETVSPYLDDSETDWLRSITIEAKYDWRSENELGLE